MISFHVLNTGGASLSTDFIYADLVDIDRAPFEPSKGNQAVLQSRLEGFLKTTEAVLIYMCPFLVSEWPTKLKK